MATDSQSALIATTMIGAMARIGTVWEATTYGTSARSARREWTNRMPRPRPRNPPRTKPVSDSRNVNRALPARMRKSGGPSRWAGSKNAATMLQMWGSERSSAIRQANGGKCS